MTIEYGTSDLIDAWASSGAKVDPGATKFNTGWTLGEFPPHEFMNFIQNVFCKQINYLIRNGVSEHNLSTPYLIGNVVQSGGNLWVAIANNNNSLPSDVNANWRKIPLITDLPDSSEVVRGLIELATAAEVATGVDSLRAVTPATLNSSGNAASATKLKTARSIGGVSFDGTANINLPGVNQTGNQDTTGNAATATLATTATTSSNSNAVGGQTLAQLDTRYSADRANSSATAVGSSIVALYSGPGVVSFGGTTIGSNLNVYNSDASSAGALSAGTTWRHKGHILGTSQNIWERIA